MTDPTLRYRLQAAALQNEEKRVRTSYAPSLILVVAVSTVVFIALGISKGATPKSMMIFGLMMAAYIACMVVWYPRWTRRRLIRCWETYELEIGHDYLLRRQADAPEIRLQFDEVQTVEHVLGRYLRVVGKSKSCVIAIPEGLDQFDEVLKTISSLRPVRVRTMEQWHKSRAFMAVGLLLYVVMLWSTAPVVVISLSLATGSVIVWAFYWIRRNPNIPGSLKWVAWIYWPLLGICILKLFLALGGTEGTRRYATLGKVVASMLVFSPCALLAFGWVRWCRVRPPRHWRDQAIAWGLGAASISALCLYGVLSYVQLAHIGYLNEHRLATEGAYAVCPLSFFSLIAAATGKGRARTTVWLAGISLAIVWSVAFFSA